MVEDWDIQIRLVMFMTGQFIFKYGRFVWTTCREMESRHSTMIGRQVFQDNNSIGQDGKCDREAIEIHDKMISRWVMKGQ